MKKIAVLFIVLFLFSLCGCNNISSKVIPVTEGLSFTAETEMDGYNSVYYVEINEKGIIEMTVKEPENISGLKFVFLNGNKNLSYNGLDYKIEQLNSQKFTAVDFLYNAFKEVAKNKKNVTIVNDEIFFLGKYKNFDFKYYIGQTGLPISIKNDDGVEIFFKNVKITEKN